MLEQSIIERMVIMPVVTLVINILLLVVAVILIAVILMQDAKTAGLGSAFGNDTTALGRSRNQKASREVKLQKLTIILASIMGVLALALLIFKV